MNVRYQKLWDMLDRRGIDLQRCGSAGGWPDEATVAAMRDERVVPVEPLLSLCRLLGCGLMDIAEFFADDGTAIICAHRDYAVPGLFNLFSAYSGAEPAERWIARIADPVLRQTAEAERLFYAGAVKKSRRQLAGAAEAAMRAGNPAAAVGAAALMAKTALMDSDTALWEHEIARIRRAGAPTETTRLALAFLACFARKRCFAVDYARTCVRLLPENRPEFYYILAYSGMVERMTGAQMLLSAAPARSAAMEISGHIFAAIAHRVEGSRAAVIDELRQVLPLVERFHFPMLLAEHWRWFENESGAPELLPWAGTIQTVRELSLHYYAGLNTLVSVQDGMTDRELMIFLGISHGLSYEEICSVLNISRNTLKTHLKHLYGKFGASSRAELERRFSAL